MKTWQILLIVGGVGIAAIYYFTRNSTVAGGVIKVDTAPPASGLPSYSPADPAIQHVLSFATAGNPAIRNPYAGRVS